MAGKGFRGIRGPESSEAARLAFTSARIGTPCTAGHFILKCLFHPVFAPARRFSGGRSVLFRERQDTRMVQAMQHQTLAHRIRSTNVRRNHP